MSAVVLVAWGVSTGLFVGPLVVHLLGCLGQHVDTGTGTLLRRPPL